MPSPEHPSPTEFNRTGIPETTRQLREQQTYTEVWVEALPSYAKEIEPPIERVDSHYEYTADAYQQPSDTERIEQEVGPDFRIVDGKAPLETDLGEGATHIVGRDGQELTGGIFMPDDSLIFSTPEGFLWQKKDGSNSSYLFPEASKETIDSFSCDPSDTRLIAATKKGVLIDLNLASGRSACLSLTSSAQTMYRPHILEDGSIMACLSSTWGNAFGIQIKNGTERTDFSSDGGILSFSSVAPDGALFCQSAGGAIVRQYIEQKKGKWGPPTVWQASDNLGKEIKLENPLPYKDGFAAEHTDGIMIFDPAEEKTIRLGLPNQKLKLLSCAPNGSILAKDKRSKAIIRFDSPFEYRRRTETKIEMPPARQF